MSPMLCPTTACGTTPHDSSSRASAICTEKTGIIHVGIGKKSFGPDKLRENFLSLATAIIRAKPPTSKGTYLQNITLASTMSPGITVDPSSVMSATGLA